MNGNGTLWTGFACFASAGAFERVKIALILPELALHYNGGYLLRRLLEQFVADCKAIAKVGGSEP